MKTLQELQAEIDLDKKLKEERKTSDDSYAMKIVERVVFWFIAAIAATAFGLFVDFIISLLHRKP